jgi:hypothetical protein
VSTRRPSSYGRGFMDGLTGGILLYSIVLQVSRALGWAS